MRGKPLVRGGGQTHADLSRIRNQRSFPMSFDRDAAVNALLEARFTRRGLDYLPKSSQPRTETEAIDIQDGVACALGPIAAWKTGSATANSEPFRAPIHADTLFVEPSHIPAKMFRVIGVEAEIVYRFGRDLDPDKGPYARNDVLDAVVSMHPAVEIVDTRFKTFGALDPLSHRADQGNHGALIVGSALTDWRILDPVRQPVTLVINGKRVCNTIGGNSAVDPVRLLVWLANIGSRSLGGLHAGQFVTTGSCTGTIFVKSAAQVTIDFQRLGAMTLAID